MEAAPGRYYWHEEGGYRYCHHYDSRGFHWYGWYIGPSFYWTRWHDGFWWWYDRDFDRWCYWSNGYWWWPEPNRPNVVYVYADNNNGNEDDAVEEAADEEDGVAEFPRLFKDAKKTRLVKVVDEEGDAFLYDLGNPPAFRPLFLASGVTDVTLSDNRGGRSLQIVLTLNDGTFALFDEDGNPYAVKPPSRAKTRK